MTAAFGIDIGGTGMKAAPVDLDTGTLTDERFRIATPRPATPEAMREVVVALVEHFGWTGCVGITFPGVIRHGVVHSAANVDPSWFDVDADALFTTATSCEVHVVNDADAAGVAEVRYGAAAGRAGVVLVLTFGTGIGSGLFVDGVLVPNTELGHLELDGHDAEHRAAASARERDGLSWKDWATHRVQPYLRMIDRLFSPELIVVGGGASRRADKWLPHLDVDTEIVPAALENEAGIVGAALLAVEASASDPTSVGQNRESRSRSSSR